jgi:hypothetical protein
MTASTAWLSQRQDAGSPALRVSPHAVGVRPPKRDTSPKRSGRNFVGERRQVSTKLPWPSALRERTLGDEPFAAPSISDRRGEGHPASAGCAAGERNYTTMAVIESRAHSRR